MKARKKLIDFLLKCQAKGYPISRGLVTQVELATIDDLKGMKKVIDDGVQKAATKKLANVKDKLVKAMFELQERGMLKDSSLIAKIEQADVETLKAIKQNIDDSLKVVSGKKEYIKGLLKDQEDGKIKDRTKIVKADLADELFYAGFSKIMAEKKAESDELSKKKE